MLFSTNHSGNFQTFLPKLVWDLVCLIQSNSPTELKMPMYIISLKYSQTFNDLDS